MITVRQIERHWESKAYERLFSDLLAARPEAAFRLGFDTARALPAAALAVIRLDELSQSHVKLYSKLIKTIVAAQEADGGWGDLVTTSLCLRALLSGNGSGPSIDGGLAYFAGLQKAEGIWPRIPIRRMTADAYVSALVLYQLADFPQFREAVRIADAVEWFSIHDPALEEETRNLWNRVKVRCRFQPAAVAMSLS